MSTLSSKIPVYSPLFWRAYFIQMRPYLLFISGIAGATGLAMQNDADVNIWKFLFSFIAFFFGYGFGQALTDCFQTDTDKLSAPYRPLSKGIISIKAVLSVSITGLLAGAVIFYLCNPLSFLLSGLVVFGLATYSYVKRHAWFGGPFYNAAVVALLPVVGFFAVAGYGGWYFPGYLIPDVFVTFFSYASFVLIGYLKDISADRETNYKTFPVVWGWNNTMIVGDLFALATLSLFWLPSHTNIYEILIGMVATSVLIYGQLYGHLTTNKTEHGALLPILATVRSFVLFHIAIIMHFHFKWLWLAVVFYFLFEITLHNRPSKYQV